MKPRKTPWQAIQWECSCGHQNQITAGHYALFDCASCGKTHWALEPKFNGGLKAFPHPGYPITAAAAAK